MNQLDIEQITPLEYLTFEKCFNADISSLNPEYVGEPTKCYGYDFSNCYGTFLSDHSVSKLMIPTKAGKFKKIDEFDIMDLDDLQYGIYNIKVSSNDPLVTQYFQFSTDNWYTIFSLQQLQSIMKFAKKYYKGKWIKPTIELITDSTYNCVVYKDKDLVTCDTVFGDWFKSASRMKAELKGNMLVKNLTTKLWGYLTQHQRHFFDEDEIADIDYAFEDDITPDFQPEYVCVGVTNVNTDKAKYQLVKTDNPYRQGGIARIKPFLVASIRKYVTDMILDSGLHENVIRICTDGICLGTRHDFTDDYDYAPIAEAKTTGYIKYYHANKYMHVCKKCKHEWKFDKHYVHECK